MLNRDFKQFVASLDSTGVEFLIVGGCAVTANGRPRHTGDIDFWVNPRPANAERLMGVLDQFPA